MASWRSFQKAAEEVAADPGKIEVWKPIIAKYHPTLIGECQKAIKWSTDIVNEWLITGMFKGATDPGPEARAKRVMDELGDHALTLSHSRHIDYQRAKDIGLNVVALEDDDKLQDAVLTVHHLCIQTIADTAVMKLSRTTSGCCSRRRSAFKPWADPVHSTRLVAGRLPGSRS